MKLVIPPPMIFLPLETVERILQARDGEFVLVDPPWSDASNRVVHISGRWYERKDDDWYLIGDPGGVIVGHVRSRDSAEQHLQGVEMEVY